MVRIAALLFALIAVVVAGGCTEGNRAREGSAELALEELYRRLERAVTRDGFVFHATMERTGFFQGQAAPQFTGEAWIDGVAGSGRQEVRRAAGFAGDTGDHTTIVTAEAVYRGAEDEKPVRIVGEFCPGIPSRILTSLFIFCDDLQGEDAPRVEPAAEYDGVPSVELVYRRLAENALEREPVELTARLILERKTLLPLAVVLDAQDRDGASRGSEVTRYSHRFIPTGSLPADFFDPASIGYAEPNPAAVLDEPDLGVPVVWLGRRFEPGRGEPALTLSESFAPRGPGSGPGYRVQLGYGAEDGRGSVRLALWRPDEWERFVQTPLGRLEWDSPCVQAREITLPSGRALIFLGYEPDVRPAPVGAVAVWPGASSPMPAPSPVPRPDPRDCPVGRPFDRFLAQVYLEGVVVAVNTPICLACVGDYGLYDTLAGIEAVVSGLRPRAPGE